MAREIEFNSGGSTFNTGRPDKCQTNMAILRRELVPKRLDGIEEIEIEELSDNSLLYVDNGGTNATVNAKEVISEHVEEMIEEHNANEEAHPYIQGELTSEVSRAQAAEATLQTNINTEASTRAAADTTLQTNINNEATTRLANDTTLQNNITAETNRATGAEATLTSNLATEVSNRQTGDTNTLNAAKSYTDSSLTSYYNKTEVDTKDTNVLNTAKQYATSKDEEVKTWADGKFLTEHQSLANYDTKAEVNTKISTATNDMATKTWSKGQVIDNTTSTINNQPLSANQGKVLSDRINNLEAVGRYLSVWNCITGKPATEPTSLPYTYKSGDYYVIGTVASSGGTNYMPQGSTYTGAASTTPYTGEEELQATMEWRYDGSTWTLRGGTGGGKVKDVLVDNVSVLSGGIAYVNLTGKQDVISDLSTIRSGAALGTTSIQPNDNITELNNNAGFITNSVNNLTNYSTTTAMNTAIASHHDSTKQDVIDSSHKLSADYISDGSTNKTVTQSEKTTWNNKSTVSVSASGTSTDEVQYITIDGVEKKLAGGGSGGGNVDDVKVNGTSVVTNRVANVTVPTNTDYVDLINYQEIDGVKTFGVVPIYNNLYSFGPVVKILKSLESIPTNVQYLPALMRRSGVRRGGSIHRNDMASSTQVLLNTITATSTVEIEYNFYDAVTLKSPITQSYQALGNLYINTSGEMIFTENSVDTVIIPQTTEYGFNKMGTHRFSLTLGEVFELNYYYNDKLITTNTFTTNPFGTSNITFYCNGYNQTTTGNFWLTYISVSQDGTYSSAFIQTNKRSYGTNYYFYTDIINNTDGTIRFYKNPNWTYLTFQDIISSNISYDSNFKTINNTSIIGSGNISTPVITYDAVNKELVIS